ncbi:family 43 glycosylhydrolase [Bifidobacterium sp. ESL0798]|uniref:family 43 glycosylhydrolase n=1 Tax=Bifidobacterium sp. ESL0798 TaxID=2983235 RepID=UPI0023F9194D|nr:family 43 glycosylhydrolase [Bifidobacterium sp. ESL0798]WEV74674.1 family 43 glycosylhydrolase [Bifidobacterium sp. ESL0798]
MSRQAVNPYLPQCEYIPDAEPYVFGDRVYIYGSHDKFNAPMFCVRDYACWSAPVSDLSDWRYDGVLYRKNQDPKNRLGLRLLFAPDVAVGTDGRYYLYYAFDFMGIMGVAVSDKPSGPFEFYGHVHYPNGKIWGRCKGDSFPFDPGVLVDDDGKVYLYSGFYTPVPSIVTGGRRKFEGGYVLELEEDMVTIKTPEKLLFPKEGEGSFPGHEFFEASSIRKYDGRYYFIYSSRLNHELCYAVSDKPDSGFVYGGTLVSNADIGINGYHDEEHAANYAGNTHGSILRLNDRFYIFYHRQTNRSSYARQACAERLERRADGGFNQAEMTSCGLNDGPLTALGVHEAYTACNLWAKGGVTGRYDGSGVKSRLRNHPFITEEKVRGKDSRHQFIANMCDGATAGFKYYEFDGTESRIAAEIRGKGTGKLSVWLDAACSNRIATIHIDHDAGEFSTFEAETTPTKGTYPLYFTFEGSGSIDFLRFSLTQGEAK